jgi:hypothetical protein
MRNAPISLTVAPAKPTGRRKAPPNERLRASWDLITTDPNFEKGWSTSLA